MLMIKDLDVSRELDGKAMSAVRGGFAANLTNAPQTISFGGDIKNSPVTVVGPITTNTAVDMSKFDFGSWQHSQPQSYAMPTDYSSGGYSAPTGYSAG
jgi:hypothetical protein